MLFPRRAPGKSEIRAPARKLFWAWLTLVLGLSSVLPPLSLTKHDEAERETCFERIPLARNRGICEAIFCGANLNSRDPDAFKEVNTVISCAMIQPFKFFSPYKASSTPL